MNDYCVVCGLVYKVSPPDNPTRGLCRTCEERMDDATSEADRKADLRALWRDKWDGQDYGPRRYRR